MTDGVWMDEIGEWYAANDAVLVAARKLHAVLDGHLFVEARDAHTELGAALDRLDNVGKDVPPRIVPLPAGYRMSAAGPEAWFDFLTLELHQDGAVTWRSND